MMKFHALILGCLLVIYSNAQEFTISGTVTDKQSGETLIAANIYNEKTLEGTVTNYFGFYSIKQKKGEVKLSCSYVGYQPLQLSFILAKDTLLSIELSPNIEIDEVVVTNKGPQQTVRSTQMSMIELPIIKTKQLPVLFEEVDIIKSLQLMPGVSGGTEGASGLYVRGGGPDQNLVLLDGVPVYNVNHLFGFFSVFNADAIKSVSLTKGGFPARFGGRLSSVVDIRMKEGNMKEFHGEGSIGLLSSKLTLEGPIKKDKTSFLISGRRTYFDLLTYPYQYFNNKKASAKEKFYTGYNFWDVNAKLNHRFSDKDRLYLSAYMGKDKFYLNNKYKDTSSPTSTNEYDHKSGIHWGNITTALRWNHLFSNRLFSNLAATFSDYTFTAYLDSKTYSKDDGDEEHDELYFKYYSRIRDIGLKYDFDYVLNNNQYLRFGINNTLHTFSPGVTVHWDDPDENNPGIDTTYGQKNIHSNEFSAYVENDIRLGSKFKMNVGLHYSNFYVQNTYYQSLQPRISARYLISPKLSVKASYVQMTQYLNLLSNSTIGLPTDLWVPSTSTIKPQEAWQTAAGFALNIGDKYQFTLEGFYKDMTNLVEYKEGASFFDIDADIEGMVTQGDGQSYGFELLLQKDIGKLTGWIGYTLAWSNRQFDEINFGETFPYRYDRRHDLSVVLSQELSKKVTLGASWVFSTGNAFTLPDESSVSFDHSNGIFPIKPQGNYGPQNNDKHFKYRNNYRMPSYHRLDFSANFTKPKKWGERVLSIGAYNVYNRQNAFIINPIVKTDEYGNKKTEMWQHSFFMFIPYIRYSFKF